MTRPTTSSKSRTEDSIDLPQSGGFDGPPSSSIGIPAVHKGHSDGVQYAFGCDANGTFLSGYEYGPTGRANNERSPRRLR
jgi:hypothetical protein